MRKAMILALALLLVSASTVLAAPPTVSATGSFEFGFGGVTASVTIDAHGIKPASGTFHFENTVNQSIDGDVTCINVDGPDAWVAGTATASSIEGVGFWALRVHDGGADPDLAIVFAGFGSLDQYCASGRRGLDKYLQTVTEGDIVVSIAH